MSKGKITVTRVPVSQPDQDNTRTAQKRGYQPPEYDPRLINQELDYVHERLNLIVGQEPISDLATTAVTADLIVTVNLILSALRQAGILREE